MGWNLKRKLEKVGLRGHVDLHFSIFSILGSIVKLHFAWALEWGTSCYGLLHFVFGGCGGQKMLEAKHNMMYLFENGKPNAIQPWYILFWKFHQKNFQPQFEAELMLVGGCPLHGLLSWSNLKHGHWNYDKSWKKWGVRALFQKKLRPHTSEMEAARKFFQSFPINQWYEAVSYTHLTLPTILLV